MTEPSDGVDRAWDLLDEGDIEGAEQAVADLDPAKPRVTAVKAAVWALRGDVSTALALFAEAAKGDPAFALPLIQGAELELYSNDDPAAALSLVERALDLVQEDEEIADCLLLKAEAQLAQDKPGAAENTVAFLNTGDIEDPTLLVRAGQVFGTLGDNKLAEAAYRDAIARDDTLADAHYGLGGIYEILDKRDAMIESWLHARDLDLDSPRPAWGITADEFVGIAEAALSELPEKVSQLLENVPVLLDEVPSSDMVKDGVDPRLLGLFTGVPLPHKSHITEQQPSIDSIYLYQRNLERFARTREELVDEIRVTVLHETAHFFGLEDDDLDALGLG